MTPPFNPYQQWLAIEAADQPPNHYVLLGIPLYEYDLQAIATAAGAQMAKIRKIRPGAQLPEWQRMLDELAAAKNCLSDSAAKAAYDQALRQQLAQSGNGSAAHGASSSHESTNRAPAADDVFQPGKNLLPPTRAAASKPSEKPASANELPSTSLNPMPPGRTAKLADAPAAASLQAPPNSGGLNPMPPSPHTSSAPATPSAPQNPPPAPTSPAPTTPGVVPMTPAAMPTFGMPTGGFPAGITPGAPFNGPAPTTPFPGGPQAPWNPSAPAAPNSAAGYPQQPLPFCPAGFPNRPLPAPGFPMPQQPFPTPFGPWGPQGANPAAPGFNPAGGYPNPQQMAGGFPGFPAGPAQPNFAPGAYPHPGGYPQHFPGAAPQAPQTQAPAAPAGNQFFDNLMDDKASPLDDLGIGGGSRAAAPNAWSGHDTAGASPNAANATHDAALSAPAGAGEAEQPQGDFGNTPSSRPLKPPAANGNSTQLALIGVGVAILAVLIVGVVIIANSSHHDNDPLADASHLLADRSGTTTTSVKTPTPPAKTIDPVKTIPTPHDKPDPPKPADVPPTPPQKEEPPKKPPEEMKPPTPAPMPQPAPTPEPAKPTPVDPAKAAQLHRLLATARVKLGERNQEEAKKLIAAAGQLAVSQDQHDLVDRLDSLEKYVGEFWSAVHDAVGALKATDEIDLGSTKVIVVEASPDSLTVHVGGQNRRFMVNQLPSGLAVGLALRWLDAKKPENKVFIGAFYLVDPKTGPEYAKQAWNEAAAAGVDVKSLLPLLQPDAPDTGVTEAETAQLAVVPEPEAQARAEKKVADEFEKEFFEATTPSKKFDLAKKLIEQGEASDDPARRYIMWRQAAELAADAGQPATMVKAVDHLAGQFRVDALDMKADALAKFPPKTSTNAKAFNDAALKLVEEALAAKRHGMADRFAQIALEAAKATKNPEVVKRTQARAKEIQDMASDAPPGT